MEQCLVWKALNTCSALLFVDFCGYRELDHQNLCRFVGCCTEPANFCVLMEYCPKGSISDVLLNDDIPLNWAFRLSFRFTLLDTQTLETVSFPSV